MRLIFILVCFLALQFSSAFAQSEELDITDIVTAQDAYDADLNNRTRSELLAALKAYEGPPTVETVNAYIIVMANDTALGRHEKIRESALAATNHLEPIARIIPKQYADSKYAAAVSYFNSDPEPEAILEMAHLRGFLRGVANEDGARAEWAIDMGWKVSAWEMAMGAYFTSVDEPYPNEGETNAIVDQYPSIPTPSSERLNPLPHCSGKLIQRPRLDYPAAALRQGRFGALFLRMHLDDEGRVVDPEVLAAVPVDEFDDRSMRMVSRWKYRPDKPRDVGVKCSLERQNLIQPLTFSIK